MSAPDGKPTLPDPESAPWPEDGFTLSLTSDARFLCLVRAVVLRACALVDMDEDDGHRVALAMDEALANVIEHAYGGAAGRPIELRLVPGAGSLRIEVRDWGEHKDASEMKGRDLEDVRPGGLGVHFIREIMSDVRWEAADGGGTRLVMQWHAADGGDGDGEDGS